MPLTSPHVFAISYADWLILSLSHYAVDMPLFAIDAFLRFHCLIYDAFIFDD